MMVNWNNHARLCHHTICSNAMIITNCVVTRLYICGSANKGLTVFVCLSHLSVLFQDPSILLNILKNI